MVHEIENFYGVYLLYCTNEQYKGRTYIGFTVNPERRKKQHNKGKNFGGAWRTHGKGPWEMVLIVHGFPNMISALRFEWAWTKPGLSRRLKHFPAKKNSERKYDYQVRVLWGMLRLGPWNRLPLTVRWLKQSYKRDFPPSLQPPMHMPLQHGPVKSVKVVKEGGGDVVGDGEGQSRREFEIGDGGGCSSSNDGGGTRSGGSGGNDKIGGDGECCGICKRRIQQEREKLACLNCQHPFHTTCLASAFLPPLSHLLPVEGACPNCQSNLLWGDLVRFKRGCYRKNESNNSEDQQHSNNNQDQQHSNNNQDQQHSNNNEDQSAEAFNKWCVSLEQSFMQE